MQDRDHPQPVLCNGIGHEIVPNMQKSEGPGSKIRSRVTHVRKHQRTFKRSLDLSNHSIGCIRTVLPNKFPDLIEIQRGFRMKQISENQLCDRRAALFSRRR